MKIGRQSNLAVHTRILEGIHTGGSSVDIDGLGFLIEIEEGFDAGGDAGLLGDRQGLANQDARRVDGHRIATRDVALV